MEITKRTAGDIQILDCSGKITFGKGTMTIRDTVQGIIAHNGKIILNLANVNYIDSSGIDELIISYTTVTNAGGQFKLLNITKMIQKLLAISKLLTVFQVFEDERAAIASFN